MNNVKQALPVAIGQTVYVAEASAHSSVDVPCPVCYGQLSVTLILGNGEHVPVECDSCGLGFNGPRGIVQAWQPTSRTLPIVVTGVEVEGDRWIVRSAHYRTHTLGHDAFLTQEEAEARRVLLAEKAAKDAERTNDSITSAKRRKPSWLVRYHREKLAEAERAAAYHRNKLSDA